MTTTRLPAHLQRYEHLDVHRGVLVERRDPQAATRPAGFVSPTLPQVDEWNAEQAFRFGYIANVVAYRCVQIRANAGAKVPLVAGRRQGDRTSLRPDAPIARLLGPPPGGPAPKLSARKLIRWTLAQEIVTGRRAWEIETDNGRPDGRPVAFWPLAAAHLRAHPSKKGNEWFRLFEYGPAHDPVKLPPELVFYGWDPSGIDFRQAESPMQAARYDLSLVTLCDRYGIGFLRNNAVPATIVTTTEFPNEAARQAFRQHWANEFGGPDNAGRTHFNEVSDDGQGPVGDTIDVKQLGLSAKDARLVEIRKDAVLEVAMALGVPWSKLDASGRTYDNADAEERTFYEETILPDLVDLQDDINMQLAPRLGDEVVWFDVDQVPALARKVFPVTQTVGAPALLLARIMTINEARADYGLEPLPDGDRFLTDDELATLKGGAGGDEAARALLVELEQRVRGTAGEPPAEAVDEPHETPPAPEPEPAAVDVDAAEERRARIWRTTDAIATQIERRWIRSLRRLFARQQEATISRLTGKRGRQALGYTADGQPDGTRAEADPVDAGAVFDVAFWTAATADVVEDLYGQAVGAGMDRIAMLFGVSFDLEAPWVAELLAERTNQLAGNVTQTTYEQILDQLVAGVAEGESIDQLADRIRQVFTIADETRAVRIARTEVISTYNAAAALTVERELPRDIVIAQEWIATRDSRTRDSHAAADGQVQLVGQPFRVGVHTAAYPGDPMLPAGEVVNCRCTIAFLTPDEYEQLDRSRPTVDYRAAKALVALVPYGDDFDLIGLRRALMEVAA